MSFKLSILEIIAKEPKLSSTIIAERLQCHPAYVRTVLHRHGIFRGEHNPLVVYNEPKASVRISVIDYKRLLKLAGLNGNNS